MYTIFSYQPSTRSGSPQNDDNTLLRQWAPPITSSVILNRVMSHRCTYTRQFIVENEDYSIAYFECIVLFEESYHWTVNKGGAHMCFIQESGIHEWLHACRAISLACTLHWCPLPHNVVCSNLYTDSTLTKHSIVTRLCNTGLTWCHMISHDITWCHMTSHDITWSHMISHDTTWCHMISHDITSHTSMLSQDINVTWCQYWHDVSKH